MASIYPKILKEAKDLRAKIYFEDESGISLNIFSGKTWALKGKSPVVYRSGQRTKRTIASAVTPDGDMYFESFEGGLTADRYISFLDHLCKKDRYKKIIIHDGLPTHRSLKVKEYIKSTKGKLKLYQLPGYSPDLNPDELVWNNLKRKIGKRAHKNLDDLMDHATSVMLEIQKDTKLIQNFYKYVYV